VHGFRRLTKTTGNKLPVALGVDTNELLALPAKEKR
jgi:hypothetical protein